MSARGRCTRPLNSLRVRRCPAGYGTDERIKRARPLWQASSVARPWRCRITGEASQIFAFAIVALGNRRRARPGRVACALWKDTTSTSRVRATRHPARRELFSAASGWSPVRRDGLRLVSIMEITCSSRHRCPQKVCFGTSRRNGRHGCGGVSALPWVNNWSVTATTTSTTTATAIKSSLKPGKVSVTTPRVRQSYALATGMRCKLTPHAGQMSENLRA